MFITRSNFLRDIESSIPELRSLPVVSPFEYKNNQFLTATGSLLSPESFIEQVLPSVNKISLVKSADGAFTVVNGYPQFFFDLKEEHQVEFLMGSMTKEFLGPGQSYQTILAPEGFEAKPYFDEVEKEKVALEKILKVDGRTVPDYLNPLIDAETATAVEIEGISFPWYCRGGFAVFRKSWDLNEEVISFRYQDYDGFDYEIRCNAEHLADRKIELNFE